MRRLNLRMIGLTPEPALIRYFFPTGNYTRTDTARTVTLKNERVALQWRSEPEGIGVGLFSLISQVKKELKDHAEKIRWPGPDAHAAPYARLEPWAGPARILELDLSAAYVRTASDIGAISAKLRDRLLQCAKRSRLIALGAVATRKTVSEYKSGKLVSSTFVQDELGRRFFEALGVHVARVMDQLRAAAGKSFAYYWADAIFVRTGAGAVYVMKAARKLGVEIKKPEEYTGEIQGPLLHLSDGRTFPAKTLERNPFDAALNRTVQRTSKKPGKKINLATPEDLRLLWDIARQKTLTAQQGLDLYRRT